jgi:Tfp pilus assembly protein PilV
MVKPTGCNYNIAVRRDPATNALQCWSSSRGACTQFDLTCTTWQTAVKTKGLKSAVPNTHVICKEGAGGWCADAERALALNSSKTLMEN